MTNSQINARLVALAAVRRRWDLGLRRANLHKAAHPLSLRSTGFLLLRRWSGSKYPRPRPATCVGIAARSTGGTPVPQTVSSDGGASYGNAIWWHVADTVSKAGVWQAGDPRYAQASVWAGGANVGPIPNTPDHVTARQTTTGAIRLCWHYNRLEQQVQPERFDVFVDDGAGNFTLGSPTDSVTYVAGLEWYSWTSQVWADGTTRNVIVRARSAAGVYSLIPETADIYIGATSDYSVGAGTGTKIRSGSLTAQAAPVAV